MVGNSLIIVVLCVSCTTIKRYDMQSFSRYDYDCSNIEQTKRDIMSQYTKPSERGRALLNMMIYPLWLNEYLTGNAQEKIYVHNGTYNAVALQKVRELEIVCSTNRRKM